MEFNEKLQELRKRKNMTQEDLAKELYVSRTAISKWESGRGYPSIDSLKEISKFFSISLDELLSGEELLNVAQEDRKKKEAHNRDVTFGLLDCGTALLYFLPIFGQRANGAIESVSLLALHSSELYVKIPYILLVLGLIICGIVTLALQNNENVIWIKYKSKISIGMNVITVVMFIISQQPYAALFILLFLAIKVLMLIKWA